MRLPLLLGILLGLGACDLSPLDDIPFENTPLERCHTVATPKLAGRWTLQGNGTRSGCVDPKFDGPFGLHSANPIDVEQEALGSGSFDPAALLAPNAPEGFRLEGQVEGSCVHVETEEPAVATPDTLHFVFDGTWTANTSVVRGDFSGSGPQGCSASGQFELTVD